MAIQNLRDKLLKRVSSTKKQKVAVDTQDRREKEAADKLAAEEAERQRLFAEKQVQEAEAKRQADLAKAAERALHRSGEPGLRNICDRWRCG